MRLQDCKQGARVRVVQIHTGEALALRLKALGLFQGEEAEILCISPRKKVWLVETASATFALGAEIAACVEVTA